MSRKTETRPSRQARGRVCAKQDNLTRDCIVAVGIFLLAYVVLTFGLGHLFGVI